MAVLRRQLGRQDLRRARAATMGKRRGGGGASVVYLQQNVVGGALGCSSECLVRAIDISVGGLHCAVFLSGALRGSYVAPPSCHGAVKKPTDRTRERESSQSGMRQI